jgi:hypothetical protein
MFDSGKAMVRSKLAYGRTMSTVFPPVSVLPNVNVMLAFLVTRALCVVSLTRYKSVLGSQAIPKTVSNLWQASIGSQMCGMFESIKEMMGLGSNDSVPLLIAWTPTSRSLNESGPRLIDKLPGANRVKS